MIAILRKRFSSRRLSRILGWTAATVTWSAVAMTAGLAAADQKANVSNVGPPFPAVNPASSTTVARFPSEPEGGLVIIKGIPDPTSRPVTVVKRIVQQQQAPLGPAPSVQQSNGS